MDYLLIRHAQTDANRLTRAAFGKEGAPINKLGLQQANLLSKELERRGVNFELEPVAVSELLRTKQTAENAGFKKIYVSSLLNEINTGNPSRTLELVAQAKLPQAAVVAAKALLTNPPTEKIWITHGLVIAALLIELGISDSKKFIPAYCEIREIQF